MAKNSCKSTTHNVQGEVNGGYGNDLGKPSEGIRQPAINNRTTHQDVGPSIISIGIFPLSAIGWEGRCAAKLGDFLALPVPITPNSTQESETLANQVGSQIGFCYIHSPCLLSIGEIFMAEWAASGHWW